MFFFFFFLPGKKIFRGMFSKETTLDLLRDVLTGKKEVNLPYNIS